MRNYTVSYRLRKGDEELFFPSERAAGEYLGVAKCTVASCYRRHSKCKGYTVERGDYTTHHATKTRLFKIWSGMHERCYRAKHPHYKDYGGRGIRVSDEWKEFEPFRDWAINNGYGENLTIDRIDVNGNYEPSNCRWVTLKEQMRNKRTNHTVIVDRDLLTLTECSLMYGVPISTIRWREAHNRDVLTGAKMDADAPTCAPDYCEIGCMDDECGTQDGIMMKYELRPAQADIDDAYYEFGRKHREGRTDD